MPDLDDAQLDAVMRRHLSAELDGQRGRAEAAFLRHVDGSSPMTDPAPRRPPAPPYPTGPRRFLRYGGWMMTLAGTALAASLAALWAGPALFPVARPQSDPPGRPQANADPSPDAGAADPSTLHYVHSRTWDEGTVVVGGPDGAPVPARRIRRVQLERARWYDPAQKAHIDVVVPREDVGIMEMDTY